MRRREFITLLGGAAAWPLAAQAQQPTKMQRIAIMRSSGNISDLGKRLEDLGYVDGKNIILISRKCRDRAQGNRGYHRCCAPERRYSGRVDHPPSSHSTKTDDFRAYGISISKHACRGWVGQKPCSP